MGGALQMPSISPQSSSAGLILIAPGSPPLALTTDTSILTAVGNDYGYDRLFRRQIEANGVSGDVFLGISTSGNSPNILQGPGSGAAQRYYDIWADGKDRGQNGASFVTTACVCRARIPPGFRRHIYSLAIPFAPWWNWPCLRTPEPTCSSILALGQRLGVRCSSVGQIGYGDLVETRMQIAILITAMILGTIVFFRLRLTGATPRNARKRDRRTGFGVADPFHAVSIHPAKEGCPAVESLKLQRFLSEEAPALPLAECGAVDCACKYVHHADRRGGARNRRCGTMEQSKESEFWSLRDRRIVLGRRHADRQVAQAG